LVNIGNYNTLKVKRKAEFGYFLDGQTKNSNDDILLHNRFIEGEKINVGDEIRVFIFKDSQNRLCATLKHPKAVVGEIQKLKVVENTEIGTFIDLGLPKDVLVPFKEKTYDLLPHHKYLFYIYLDKSNRIAATTNIDSFLTTDHNYNIGDNVVGVVYGFQTNNSAMVCIDNKYAGVILHNEYFTELNIGDEVELKVIKIYEDNKLGLTPRKERAEELDTLEKKILSYIEGNDGFMRFNDKSTPEEIKTVFNSSKKNFKRTLGILMKKGIITQDENGTYLK
jgi:hypothetical protein